MSTKFAGLVLCSYTLLKLGGSVFVPSVSPRRLLVVLRGSSFEWAPSRGSRVAVIAGASDWLTSGDSEWGLSHHGSRGKVHPGSRAKSVMRRDLDHQLYNELGSHQLSTIPNCSDRIIEYPPFPSLSPPSPLFHLRQSVTMFHVPFFDTFVLAVLGRLLYGIHPLQSLPSTAQSCLLFDFAISCCMLVSPFVIISTLDKFHVSPTVHSQSNFQSL